jgi:hypothetical protein
MGNRLPWMFLNVVEGSWTSFLAMEHVVGLLTRLLTLFLHIHVCHNFFARWTIGLLGEPSRLSLAMDNLVDLGETILRDDIRHDGVALQGLCVGS